MLLWSLKCSQKKLKTKQKNSETPRFLGTAEPQTVSRKSSPELLADRGVKEKSFMTMITNIGNKDQRSLVIFGNFKAQKEE